VVSSRFFEEEGRKVIVASKVALETRHVAQMMMNPI